MAEESKNTRPLALLGLLAVVILGVFLGTNPNIFQLSPYDKGFNANGQVSQQELESSGGAILYCLKRAHDYADWHSGSDIAVGYQQGCLDRIVGNSSTNGAKGDALDASSVQSEEPKPDPVPPVDQTDFMQRLNGVGNSTWKQDAFAPTSDRFVGWVADYISDQNCTAWIFENEKSAELTYNAGQFYVWPDYTFYIFTDDPTGFGVVVMIQNLQSGCALDAAEVFDLNLKN